MKYIDPSFDESATAEEKEIEKTRKQTVKITNKDQPASKEGKKGCC